MAPKMAQKISKDSTSKVEGSGEFEENQDVKLDTGEIPDGAAEVVHVASARDSVRVVEEMEAIYKGPEKKNRFPLMRAKTIKKFCPHCKELMLDGENKCLSCGKYMEDREGLTPGERETIRCAFYRFDLDRSKSLNGKEVRMALRELGYDTSNKACHRWADVGGYQGLSVMQFEHLIASGKLGPKCFGDTEFSEGNPGALSVEQRQKRDLMKMVSKFSRKGPRTALKLDPNRSGFPKPCSSQGVVAYALPAPPLGALGKFQDAPARWRNEIKEVWNHWDRDGSCFMTAEELDGGLRGLGFTFEPADLVAYCMKSGGGINKEQFYAVAAAQVVYREKELGIIRALLGKPPIVEEDDRENAEEEEEDAKVPKKQKKKRKKATPLVNKKMLEQAWTNSRLTSCTNSKGQWRSLFTTTHRQLAKHSVGVRLYFDIILTLIACFTACVAVSSPFMNECQAGNGLGHLLYQVDPVVGHMTKLTVANLDKTSDEKGLAYCLTDTVASFIFLVVMIIFRFVVVPASLGRIGGARLQELAVQVRGLPRDLGDLHEDYEEYLYEHFTAVSRAAADAEKGSECSENPVREVVLWRNYQGDVYGVMEQVRLIRNQAAIDARLDQIAEQARCLGVKDLHGGVEVDEDPKLARRSRQIGKVEPERNRAEKREIARLRDKHSTLRAKRELLEEAVLKIETSRSAHADLKLEERDVLGAFVLFGSQKARDDVFMQFRWSRTWLGRLLQKKHLRFAPHAIGEPAPFSYPLVVEETQDPTVQLWENFDTTPVARFMLKMRSCSLTCAMMMLATILAFFLRAGRIDYPLYLPVQATVWVLANSSQSEFGASFGPCEIELYGNADCTTDKLVPDVWVSSNQLPEGHDLGLQSVHDGKMRAGSVCQKRWLPEQDWQAITVESLAGTCHTKGPCRQAAAEGESGEGGDAGAAEGRRLNARAAVSAGARKRVLEETFKEEDAIASAGATQVVSGEEGDQGDAARRLSSWTCYWPKWSLGSNGEYETSALNLIMRYQTKAPFLEAERNVEALLKRLLVTITGEAPNPHFQRRMYSYALNGALGKEHSTKQVVYLAPDQSAQGNKFAVSRQCADKPEGPKLLLELLGISGPDADAIRSCRQMAEMGLLGYPYCALVPQNHRGLCAQTCECSCVTSGGSFEGTCDDSGEPSASLWADEPSGNILTVEVSARECITESASLEGLTCPAATDVAEDGSGPDADWTGGLLSVPQQEILLLRQNKVYFVAGLVGPPVKGTCGDEAARSVGPCRTDQLHCMGRLGDETCAQRCDGVVECRNGLDELDCAHCAAMHKDNLEECSQPWGQCNDLDTGPSPCAECGNPDDLRSTASNCNLLVANAGTTENLGHCLAEPLCQEFEGDHKKCDPADQGFDPCACLAARRSREDREPFNCLVYGNSQNAMFSESSLAVYYPCDEILAGKTYDFAGGNELTCESPTGPAVSCATSTAESVRGASADFLGEQWLKATDDTMAQLSFTEQTVMFMIFSANCPNCYFAELLAGGKLLTDGQGKLGSHGDGDPWLPQVGAKLDDGRWHHVAQVISADKEVLYVDGEKVGERAKEEVAEPAFSLGGALVQLPEKEEPEATWAGRIDEVMIFSTALSTEKVRYHLYASTWRGTGLTFAERYLAMACQDSRAVSHMVPCGADANAVLATKPCQQGDPCACLASVPADDQPKLQCSLGCANSSSGLARSALSLLEEQCSDLLQRADVCESNQDCQAIHTAYSVDSEQWICNTERQRCELNTGKMEMSKTRYIVHGRVCIASSSDKPRMNQYQAQKMLAGMLEINMTTMENFEYSEGCDDADLNLAGWKRILSAQDGTDPLLFDTGMPSVSSDWGYIADYTWPERSEHTTDIFISTAGMLDNVGGYNTATFTLAPYTVPSAFTADTALLEEQLQYVDDIQNLAGVWIADIGKVTAQDIKAEKPNIKVDRRTYTTPPQFVMDAWEYAGYMVTGSPWAMLTSETIADCGRNFECSPGVCIPCRMGVCVCDGFAECPNGEDELYTSEAMREQYPACVDMMEFLNGTVSNGTCLGEKGLQCDGLCIPPGRRCDGIADCKAGEDEEDCPVLEENVGATGARPWNQTWIGAVFREPKKVKCMKVFQNAGDPVVGMEVRACMEGAVNHATAEYALASPWSACWLLNEVTGPLPAAAAEARPTLPWSTTRLDAVENEAVIDKMECALGPLMRDAELVSFGTALLAWYPLQSNETSEVVECFCQQRLLVEPEVYVALEDTDLRYQVCKKDIQRVNLNYHKVWIRTVAITAMNQLFLYCVNIWAQYQRFKDHTLKVRAHFWILAIILFISTGLGPACMNWDLSLREWHTLVGNSITLMMMIRVLIPHGIELLALPLRACTRRRKQMMCATQDQLDELYTNPQFKLAEAYAEISVTACVSLVFSPGMPFLNVLAVMSLVCRYICDWIIFLRGSCKPPCYDEVAACHTVKAIILALAGKTLVTTFTFMDQTIFPSRESPDCGVATGDVVGLREEYQKNILWHMHEITYKECSAEIWQTGIFPAMVSMGTFCVLPFVPLIFAFLRRCRLKGSGVIFKQLADARATVGLISTYAPRHNPEYGSAFKLIDLTAGANDHDILSSSEGSSGGSDYEDDDDMEGVFGGVLANLMGKPSEQEVSDRRLRGAAAKDERRNRRRKRSSRSVDRDRDRDRDRDENRERRRRRKDETPQEREERRAKRKQERKKFEEEDQHAKMAELMRGEFDLTDLERRRRRREKRTSIVREDREASPREKSPRHQRNRSASPRRK